MSSPSRMVKGGSIHPAPFPNAPEDPELVESSR